MSLPPVTSPTFNASDLEDNSLMGYHNSVRTREGEHLGREHTRRVELVIRAEQEHVARARLIPQVEESCLQPW